MKLEFNESEVLMVLGKLYLENQKLSMLIVQAQQKEKEAKECNTK